MSWYEQQESTLFSFPSSNPLSTKNQSKITQSPLNKQLSQPPQRDTDPVAHARGDGGHVAQVRGAVVGAELGRQDLEFGGLGGAFLAVAEGVCGEVRERGGLVGFVFWGGFLGRGVDFNSIRRS